MRLLNTISQAIALALASPIVLAATDADSDTQKDAQEEYQHTEHIVVSGTRTPKLLSDSPVSVQVIDAKTIDVLTTGTLAQALNYIQGVVVTRSVKDGYNIQMQGFDGDHVLVLVNSRPVVSPTGSSTDLDQISTNDIVQIEVVRGAASVMYGSSAMGGVINIITKTPDENSAKISYELAHFDDNAISGDEYGHTAKLSTSIITGEWANSLNILYIDNPGFDYDKTTVNQDAGGNEKSFVNFSSSKEFEPLTLTLAYQYLEEDKSRATSQIPGQDKYISYLSEVEQHQFDINLASAIFDKAQHKTAQTSWQLNGRYINHEETSGQSNSLRDTEIELIELDGQHVWSGSSLEVVAGGVAHVDTLNQIKPSSGSVEIDDESRQSVEAYLQSNWIDKDYQILAGLRAQHDSDFGEHSAIRISGMMNLGNKENRVQWRTGLGQGYRVPNLKERFYVFDHSNLGYKVYGNEDLKPEESLSFNSTLSYETLVFEQSSWLSSAELSAEINLHYTQTENFIETVIDAEKSAEEGLEISTYENISEATLQGVDVSTELRFDNWYGQLNYSYLDARDENGQRLEERPYHQVKANLGYSNLNQDIDALLYLVYQANESYSNSFTQSIDNEWVTVNFSFTHGITDNLSWRFGIENIFDEHSSPVADQEQLFDAREVSSRRFSLGASYKF
ncbi:TonB-dependent receptor [Catenovulum sp. SM1970]|uniref:TonB-dependent receptor plug domain-containing protein n=1 Tax=Marinifaba aquimaris TaxID=2741323 RepID=UPI001572D3D7|nr:TonB-dependent receptor [Marinifaba aquimaris]NTS77095.1 TonB-dependent receptor [Marinifaba aquimaris]